MVPRDLNVHFPNFHGAGGHFYEEDIDHFLGNNDVTRIAALDTTLNGTWAPTVATDEADDSSGREHIASEQEINPFINHHATNSAATLVLESSDPEAAKAAQSRSERKRSREKQRRMDVNKQFSNLTGVLQRIGNEENKEAAGGEDESLSSLITSFNPSNRIDLISRTVACLERLHESNKKQKLEIKEQKKELEEVKKAGEKTAAKLKEAEASQKLACINQGKMMMMMPVMMSGGNGAMMMPSIMPQTYCPFPYPAMASGSFCAAPMMATAAPSTVTISEATTPITKTVQPSDDKQAVSG